MSSSDLWRVKAEPMNPLAPSTSRLTGVPSARSSGKVLWLDGEDLAACLETPSLGTVIESEMHQKRSVLSLLD